LSCAAAVVLVATVVDEADVDEEVVDSVGVDDSVTDVVPMTEMAAFVAAADALADDDTLADADDNGGKPIDESPGRPIEAGTDNVVGAAAALLDSAGGANEGAGRPTVTEAVSVGAALSPGFGGPLEPELVRVTEHSFTSITSPCPFASVVGVKVILQVSVTTPSAVSVVVTVCTVCGPVSACRRARSVPPWGRDWAGAEQRRRKAKRKYAAGRKGRNIGTV